MLSLLELEIFLREPFVIAGFFGVDDAIAVVTGSGVAEVKLRLIAVVAPDFSSATIITPAPAISVVSLPAVEGFVELL